MRSWVQKESTIHPDSCMKERVFETQSQSKEPGGEWGSRKKEAGGPSFTSSEAKLKCRGPSLTHLLSHWARAGDVMPLGFYT